MKEEKKMKNERRHLFTAGHFDGDTLQEAITNMTSFFTGLPDSARLDYDYSDQAYFVVWQREETIAEYARRVATENTDRAIRESAEKRQLRELMQKYPDVVTDTQKQG